MYVQCLKNLIQICTKLKKKQSLKYRETCVLYLCYDGNFELIFHGRIKDIS